jgi:GntR family transcriptional regulator
LAINPNTVARAYRELQNDGVLEQVRGTGLAVTSTAHRYCRAERVKMIRARARLVVEEALQSGLDATEVEGLLGEELAAAQRSKTKSNKSRE